MADKDIANEVISIPPTDGLLGIMNRMSNFKEVSIGCPVTLFVKGTIITGNIISFEKYMEKTAANLRAATINTEPGLDTSPIRDAIAQSFDEICAAWKPSAEEDPHMIHLENVKILNTDGRKTDLINSLWRGQLGAIDGFILGTLD